MSKKDTIQPFVARGKRENRNMKRTEFRRTEIGELFEPDDSFERWIDDTREKLAVENWREIGATGNPTFENSWANVGAGSPTAAFYKDPFDIVRVRGAINSGTTNTTAFTLPTEYRPAVQLYFPIVASAGATPAYVRIDTTGTVTPVGTAVGTFSDIGTIQFRI